jgi:hypothetical protein
MNKNIVLIVFAGLALSIWPASASGQTFEYYGDLTQQGSTWLDQKGFDWDLTRCDLSLSYTLDMSKYYPEWKNTEWTMVGIGSGAWVWMTSGAPAAAITYPDRHDIDDKLHLGGMPNKIDESTYDVLYPHTVVNAPIGDPWSNYGIWFDRDGISKTQSEIWGLNPGITFNTGGIYQVNLVYHALNPDLGTVFSTVNGVQSGFYDGWKNAPPDYYPVGMSFSGDLTQVKVFASLWGHNVKLEDIQASGCLAGG